jgi:hypothetical protein
MAKTRAQVEKKKRETEKRKKLEKEVRKIAAGMPDDDPNPAHITQAKAAKGRPPV